jgi:hypothetical protein
VPAGDRRDTNPVSVSTRSAAASAVSTGSKVGASSGLRATLVLGTVQGRPARARTLLYVVEESLEVSAPQR